MNPNQPRNDKEWEELLSAYLDGELEAGERLALESWLARHPGRAAQLDELRRLGGLLDDWSVEAPDPDPAFLRRLARLTPAPAAPPRPRSWRDALRRLFWWPAWPVAAVLFLGGVLSGVAGSRLLQDRPGAPAPLQVAAVHETAARSAPVISPDRAATLSRELQAAELRDRLMGDLQRRDYDSAARRYQDLTANYRDSAALRQLHQNPTLRAAAQRLETTGRI